MSRSIYKLVFRFLSIISAVFADDGSGSGYWLNPPGFIGLTNDYSTNPVYVVGRTTELNWTTTYTYYSITLWQHDPVIGRDNLGPVIYRTSKPSSTILKWPVYPSQFDLTVSNIFFLLLYPDISPGDVLEIPQDRSSIVSHYFNISEANNIETSSTATPPASISNSASASVSVLVSTTYISVSSTGTVPTLASSGGTAPGHGSAVSPGAWAGIGIGAALLGIIAITAIILWRRRRNRNRLQPQVQPQVLGHSELSGWGERKVLAPTERRWPAEPPAGKIPVDLGDTERSDQFRAPAEPFRVSLRELPG